MADERRNQRAGQPRSARDQQGRDQQRRDQQRRDKPRTGAPSAQDRGRAGQRDDRPTRPPRPPRPGQAVGQPERAPTPPGLARRENEPRLPAEVDTSKLHRAVRAELRGLPKDLAEVVAGHLVLAGELIDTDPELAYGHAEAARRRAARLPIVREATAETAYAAGHFDVALSEFRALRRMTGVADYLPVMADCERALGRPQAAVKLAKEARHANLDPALQVEMIIVEAGARADLGQAAEGLRILEQAVHAVGPRRTRYATAVARLEYVYADALLRDGQEAVARQWFASAAELDVDGETDAAVRRDELDGMIIAFDDSADDAEAVSEDPPR